MATINHDFDSGIAQEWRTPEKINSIERGVHWLLGKIAPIGPQGIAWAQAMLCARGVEGTRVLQCLIALAKRHSSEALENARKTALSSGEFRLKTIRQLAARPSPMVQAELPFLDEHPLIRPLDDYARMVADALARKPESPEPSGAVASDRDCFLRAIKATKSIAVATSRDSAMQNFARRGS